jgi:RNA polymerase sigma factor (sigma-70 family)
MFLMHRAAKVPAIPMSAKPHESPVEAVLREHGHQLERFFIARVRTVADARDLAQELYLRLIRLRAETWEQVEDPRRYVYTAAINLCREYKIKKREEAAGRLRWQGEQPIATDDNDSGCDWLQNKRLRAALETLRPKCRAVIVLHRCYGWKYEEIGHRLGISSSMVKKYLKIGLVQLRAFMMTDPVHSAEPTTSTHPTTRNSGRAAASARNVSGGTTSLSD